jgi:hypothetical protein
LVTRLRKAALARSNVTKGSRAHTLGGIMGEEQTSNIDDIFELLKALLALDSDDFRCIPAKPFISETIH